MDTPPLHPDAVEFDAMECCALECACGKEAHASFVREYLGKIGESHPLYKASLILGIFQHTFHLAFIPSEVHRVVYAHIANTERELLAQDKEALLDSCGHTANQHCQALESVWAKIKPATRAQEVV